MANIKTTDLPDVGSLTGSESVVGNQSGNTVKIPLTILNRDPLRKAVETASGGRQTVLYTAKGQPSYMYVLPAFSLEDLNAGLGTGLHPAFTVGGVAKREVFIGVYQGLVSNGELISLPGVDPSNSRNHDSFVSTARANGPGWHCITNAEWSALALWCWKNGFQPRGNNNFGRDIDSKWETGRRQDGGIPGDATGGPAARTLTGSGPASWRHDNSLSGISDLNGNIWEWTPGLRLCAGEFQVIADNDAALNATDFSPTSAAWKAIDGDTGDLITPTFTGTIAGGDYVATTPKSVRIAASGTSDYTVVRGTGGSLEGMTNPGIVPVSADALARLKRLGLYPVAATGLGGDGIWHTQDVERLPLRGGAWYIGAAAGVFALNLDNSRASAGTGFGSRPAFVL